MDAKNPAMPSGRRYVKLYGGNVDASINPETTLPTRRGASFGPGLRWTQLSVESRLAWGSAAMAEYTTLPDVCHGPKGLCQAVLRRRMSLATWLNSSIRKSTADPAYAAVPARKAIARVAKA